MIKTSLLKNENGITLITLVVTVIVAIILFAVIIKGAMNLFSSFDNTKESTSSATEKDQLIAAVKDAKTGDYIDGGAGGISKEALEKALDDLVGKNKTEVYIREVAGENLQTNNEIQVYFKESKRLYTINSDGTIQDEYTTLDGNTENISNESINIE